MKKVIYFLILFVFFITSCSKENLYTDTLKSPVSTKNVISTNNLVDDADNTVFYDFSDSEYTVNCYLDNVPVKGITVNNDEDNWTVYLTKLDENSNEIVEVRKFTKKEDYMKYGDNNGIPLREEVGFSEEMKKYVDDNDIIQYYEENGNVPDSYLEYEKSIYEKYFGRKTKKVQSRNLWIQLWKKCRGDEGSNQSIPMFNTYPFMPWGWNNKVSQNEVVGFFAGTAVYDWTFYRKHIGTVWLMGMSKKCWHNTALDDRMSSGIKVF